MNKKNKKTRIKIYRYINNIILISKTKKTNKYY